MLLNASVRVVRGADHARLRPGSGTRWCCTSVKRSPPRVAATWPTSPTLVAQALDNGGTFYLPYQQHYTRGDLARAYPRIDEFFALKRRYDPELRFMNNLYRLYA